MSEEIILQTNPASRILVYSSSIDTARDFVSRVKALSASKSSSSKGVVDIVAENTELQRTAHSDVISHILSNKYYTADVHFSLKSMQTLTSETFHHTNAAPALIYVWTTNEVYSNHIQLLSHTMQSMEYEPEVCLGVRLAAALDLSTKDTDTPALTGEENTVIDGNLLSYGFEYVDASRERTKTQVFQADDDINATDSEGDDDDIPDLPRVLDALSTIMWSNMRSKKPAQNEVSSNELDDSEKEERNALLAELLSAGQDVRSSESQASKETATTTNKNNEKNAPEDDEDEEKLMQQMEMFIQDANALSSFSSYKGFSSTDADFPSEKMFTPSNGLGSLDSLFDFSAFTGKTRQAFKTRIGSTAPLLDSKTGDVKPSGKLWLDIHSGLHSNIASPLTATSASSSQASAALTTSPVDEAALDSFGKLAGPSLPTITKHGFDDDFTEFVSAPAPPTSAPVDPSHLSLGVPSLRRSVSRSSSFASDFGDHDDEHVYAMLDDTSSFGGDDLDRDLDESLNITTDDNIPKRNEILATTRQLFGGQMPIRNKTDATSQPDSSNTGTSSSEGIKSTPIPKDTDANGTEAFDLGDVLNSLQRFKSEIGGMTDEEEKKRMAARVALGLVYGLEGQEEDL